MTLVESGRLEEALPHLEGAVDGRRRTLGARHPRTLVSMTNLGQLYRRLGRLADAASVYEESLDAKREVFGPEHPETLTSINNLSLVLLDLERYDEAASMLEGHRSERQHTGARGRGPHRAPARRRGRALLAARRSRLPGRGEGPPGPLRGRRRPADPARSQQRPDARGHARATLTGTRGKDGSRAEPVRSGQIQDESRLSRAWGG